MRQLSITASITVTIGRHTRQYFAYVTTAPAELDLRKTVTLHQGPFSDVVGLAADPITHDERRAHSPARLVLIEAYELAWQRATYRGTSLASSSSTVSSRAKRVYRSCGSLPQSPSACTVE